jgi:hypothetical protein
MPWQNVVEKTIGLLVLFATRVDEEQMHETTVGSQVLEESVDTTRRGFELGEVYLLLVEEVPDL